MINTWESVGVAAQVALPCGRGRLHMAAQEKVIHSLSSTRPIALAINAAVCQVFRTCIICCRASANDRRAADNLQRKSGRGLTMNGRQVECEYLGPSQVFRMSWEVGGGRREVAGGEGDRTSTQD